MRASSSRVAVRTAARVTGALLVVLAGGCAQDEDAQREDYCESVADRSAELTRLTDEGGPAAFLEALPVLEDLAEESPDDLRDEWRTFLDALHGLEDAVAETGLDPADLTGEGLPDDLPAADRRRLRGAASVLASPDVVAATQGIEQHALDVCHTPLL